MVPQSATALAPRTLLFFNLNQQRLDGLRAMRDRWIAEYPDVAATDPVRATEHAQALVDLQRLIEREEHAQAPVPALSRE